MNTLRTEQPIEAEHAAGTVVRVRAPHALDARRRLGPSTRTRLIDPAPHHPGSLIHVDVAKFGNIPDGGGWRFFGKQHEDRNRESTAKRTGQRHARDEPNIGTAFVHTVIDDHSCVAYAEICTDEKAVTAI